VSEKKQAVSEKKQALDGTRLNAFAMDPEELHIVGLDGDEGEEHVLWDERANAPVDQEKVDNVLKYGVLETVVVRKTRLPSGEFRVEVVYGRQRVKWAREANTQLLAAGSKDRVRVPVMLVRNTDEKAQAGMIEAENGVRVVDDQMTKARKAQRLMTRQLMSEQEVAVAMGVSREAVRQWMVLLGLSKKLQGAVERGVLSGSTAILFNDLPHEEQDKRIETAESLGVTITKSEARRQRTERVEGRTSDDQTVRAKPVSARVLRKLLDQEEFLAGLPREARFILKWAAGEAGAERNVPGLRKVLREIGAIKSPAETSDAAAE
jgi:hypothetical protein